MMVTLCDMLDSAARDAEDCGDLSDARRPKFADCTGQAARRLDRLLVKSSSCTTRFFGEAAGFHWKLCRIASGRSRKRSVRRSNRTMLGRRSDGTMAYLHEHVRLQVLHGVGNQLDGRDRVRRWGVTLENQIRGLAVVFGIRSPRALSAASSTRLFKPARGSPGLSAAMRGLIAARTAVMTAVAAIDADMRRSEGAGSRPMTIP